MNNENGNIVKGDPDKDFFEQNPELELHNFGHLIIERLGREEAGIVMWAIYLTEDPDSSVYQAMMTPIERREMIQKTYLNKKGIKKVNWDGLSTVIQGYTRSAMPLQKKRFKWINDAFNSFLEEINTNEELALEKKAQVFGSVEKMYKGLAVAEKAFMKEKETGARTSGREQSGGASSRRNRQR